MVRTKWGVDRGLVISFCCRLGRHLRILPCPFACGGTVGGRQVSLSPGVEDELPQISSFEGVFDGVSEVAAVIGVVARMSMVVTVVGGVAGSPG
jgi:hypothetical protein